MEIYTDKNVLTDTATTVVSQAIEGDCAKNIIPKEWFVSENGTVPNTDWYFQIVESPFMSLIDLISLIRSYGPRSWKQYVQTIDPIITQQLINNNKCLLVVNHTILAAGTCRSLAAADYIIHKCRQNLGWCRDDHVEVLIGPKSVNPFWVPFQIYDNIRWV